MTCVARIVFKNNRRRKSEADELEIREYIDLRLTACGVLVSEFGRLEVLLHKLAQNTR